MDRDALNCLLNKKLATERQILYESYATHRKAVNEAPSPMQSRYDTSRSELSEVADALAERISSIERLILCIQSLRGTRNIVQLGSILQVKERNQEYYLFIVPDGAGGNNFVHEGMRIVTVAPMSLIGKAVIGKEEGDEVEVTIPTGIKTLEIIAIR